MAIAVGTEFLIPTADSLAETEPDDAHSTHTTEDYDPPANDDACSAGQAHVKSPESSIGPEHNVIGGALAIIGGTAVVTAYYKVLDHIARRRREG